jgi:hypothetical protein
MPTTSALTGSAIAVDSAATVGDDPAPTGIVDLFNGDAGRAALTVAGGDFNAGAGAVVADETRARNPRDREIG